MTCILDTHVFLWFITGDDKLSQPLRRVIEEPGAQVCLSMASAWELAIKSSLGKLTLSRPFEELIPHEIDQNGFRLLPITLEHLCRVAVLPFHHRDPFDRVIIAQGIVEGLPIATADRQFEAYGVQLIY